jgi:ABC-2 type transport system permease protein
VSGLVYTRYELLRTLRNRRYTILALIIPTVVYLLIAVPQRHSQVFSSLGISARLYYMVGMATFGTMNAVLSSGVRIAAERSVGWNRQLRLTPLTIRSYFRAKIVTAYVLALLTLAVMAIAGTAVGVRLDASEWVEMVALIAVGLVPFAAMGILFGHLLSADAVAPAMGGTTAFFALLGGSWYPITGSGTFAELAKLLPSYWLVRASHVALGGSAWSPEGWLVIAAWSAAMVALAAKAYRRDTLRV